MSRGHRPHSRSTRPIRDLRLAALHMHIAHAAAWAWPIVALRMLLATLTAAGVALLRRVQSLPDMKRTSSGRPALLPTRWARASENAVRSPASRLSTVRKPVRRGTSTPRVETPEIGTRPSFRPIRVWAIMASQKVGRAPQKIAASRTELSVRVRCRAAASTPSGTPQVRLMSIARPTSSTV